MILGLIKLPFLKVINTPNWNVGTILKTFRQFCNYLLSFFIRFSARFASLDPGKFLIRVFSVSTALSFCFFLDIFIEIPTILIFHPVKFGDWNLIFIWESV